ncbi:hypothetical protein [Parasediminibacterium sp. JCM 36343]|uniref:hypothetical protein n=1 Tax=Parasediminibacterium sp. JCM 36343 TaxID=3374279 RepID=UPI00397BCE2C
MERIVIEVDDNLAKAWQQSTDTKRKAFGNKINMALAKEFIGDSTQEYLAFLKQLRLEMKQKGLTQAELDKILNDE